MAAKKTRGPTKAQMSSQIKEIEKIVEEALDPNLTGHRSNCLMKRGGMHYEHTSCTCGESERREPLEQIRQVLKGVKG